MTHRIFTGPVQNLAKKILYTLQPPSFLESVKLRLGMIFHTEKVFDKAIFEKTYQFCEKFLSLSGKRAICTLMPPTNFRIAESMKKVGLTNAEFLDRVRQLESVSTLGYHGHFWKSTNLPLKEFEMRDGNFDYEYFKKQAMVDISWFSENKVSHNGIYAAGWWFIHPAIQIWLIENGFTIDFSFSKAPWFQKKFAKYVFENSQTQLGEAFQIKYDKGHLRCIQNLTGFHQTPYPEDFLRVLQKIGDKIPAEVIGVGNTHDFDLEPDHSMKCLEYLLEEKNVSILGVDDFRLLSIEKEFCYVADHKENRRIL